MESLPVELRSTETVLPLKEELASFENIEPGLFLAHYKPSKGHEGWILVRKNARGKWFRDPQNFSLRPTKKNVLSLFRLPSLPL